MELDYKALYHHAPCGYLSTKQDGTLIEVNDTFLLLTGYSREEVIENKRFEDFLSLGGIIYYETHFAPLLQMQGEVSEINFDLIRKDNTRLPALVNAIQHSANEMEHSYIQFIVIDISQRKQYELELMNAKRKSEELLTQLANVNKELANNIQIVTEQRNQLEEANATKDKFFSIVAHDLKSPLISVKGLSAMLINHFDGLNKDEILTVSKRLLNSVDNTLKLADNLITWARLQMKEFLFHEETMKVRDVISNIFDLYQKVALGKGICMDFSVDESLKVVGDRNQIEFVIRNIVNNAIKFTPQNGFVSLKASSLPDGLVLISISDSGVGISDEIIKKLYSIDRIHSANGTNGEKGTGLGLMLSYEFIKLNGGQIDVESSLGQGSTFHIKLKSGQ